MLLHVHIFIYLDYLGQFCQSLNLLLKGTYPKAFLVENRHDDIQGICFLLITITISEKDVPFAQTPPLPLSPFVPFWLTPSPP